MNGARTNIDISIIIPVYKVERYIERCVRCLMEQTKKDGIEFLFVNDCTPDASMEIIDSVLVPLGGSEKFVVAAALANLIGDSGVARLNRIDYLHTRHTSLVGNALDGRLKGSDTRLNLADGAIKVR